METTRMLKAFERWGAKTSQTAILLSILGLPAVALAQAKDERAPASNADGLDTHLFRPAVDSKGFFSVNGSDILGAGDVSFGLVLDYGRNLLRTSNGTLPNTTTDRINPDTGDPVIDPATGQPIQDPGPCTPDNCKFIGGAAQSGSGVKALVRDSFQGTFQFNYGIANAGVVGVNIPVILMAGDPAFNIGPTGGTYNSARLDAQGLSTIALHGKVRFTRVEKGIGLGALVQVGIPIGSAPENLGADPGAWFWPQLIAEKRFSATGRFKIGLNVGYRAHTGKN